VLVALAALVAVPAAADATPTITEHAAGLTQNAAPRGVTAGLDGAIWFTEDGNDAIGRIAPDGSVCEYGGLTFGSPHGITTGPDGNLWFTETGGSGAIGRMTPAGVVTEFTTGLLTGNPQEIAAGADGNLWFTESGVGGAIGRITPTGTITEFTWGLTPNRAPWGITAGPDGTLWFTEKSNSGYIGRITTSGVITEFGGLPAGLPQWIAAGPDGNLWYTAAASPGYIGRVTPAGVVTAFSAGVTPGSNPQGITAGPDGALWFTEKSASAIGRITTAGEVTEYADGISANSAPFGIAAGADGNLWFAENNSPARLGRLALDGDTHSGSDRDDDRSAPTQLTLPPAAATPGAAVAAPVPALGRSIVVAASSGVIRVRRPGQRTFRVVSAGALQPTGTEIDARHGTALLTTSLGGGRVQRASFRGTYFKVRQSKGRRGLTDIVLTAGAATRTGGARAAAVVRRKPPSLWAHDSHGRYRTFGRNSVASVRGTTWRTTEQQAGTLTQVSSGSVSVRDLRHRRTVLVRAGHRYLARAH
jgi:streptogramin lyase